MRAFKVNLNGKRICVAGVGRDGVLTAIVGYVGNGRRSDLDIYVSGLFSPTEEHAIWRRRRLKVGDRVAITVVETNSIDKPRERYRPDSKTAERNQKSYIRAWAKKYGWQLLTRPKKSR